VVTVVVPKLHGEAAVFLHCVITPLIGLQHFVIEPPQPYGMPLNFKTLAQELKEAGKKCLTHPPFNKIT